MTAAGRACLLAAALAAAVVAACGADGGGTLERERAAEAGAPRQFIVVVDLSGSQTPQMLEDGKRFLQELVESVSFGDQIVLLEMHQAGLGERIRRWSDSVPRLRDPTFVSSRDRTRLEGVRQAARSAAGVLFDPSAAGRATRTDIFSTLHVAAEYARDAGGRTTTLVLLSDMLQSANGVEMKELRRMPGPDWIQRSKAEGILPALKGVCVVVIGANPTTAEGIVVKDFWLRYFTESGARLSPANYRVLATQAQAVSCGA